MARLWTENSTNKPLLFEFGHKKLCCHKRLLTRPPWKKDADCLTSKSTPTENKVHTWNSRDYMWGPIWTRVVWDKRREATVGTRVSTSTFRGLNFDIGNYDFNSTLRRAFRHIYPSGAGCIKKWLKLTSMISGKVNQSESRILYLITI